MGTYGGVADQYVWGCGVWDSVYFEITNLSTNSSTMTSVTLLLTSLRYDVTNHFIMALAPYDLLYYDLLYYDTNNPFT